jgi:glycosyltransferase involved in cell wall biosynthesis
MGRKYLFVINSFLAGGAERSLVEMLPRLVEEGVTPIIASLYYREVGFEEEVREAGYDVRLLSGEGRIGKALALRKLIQQESPDLVYTSLFDADLAGWLATIGLDVPLISNLANTAYDSARLADPNIDERRLRVIRSIDGYTSRHGTDHFHAVSHAVKDSTVETLGVDPDRITVVKRGRDADRLGRRTSERRVEARSRLGIPEDALVVVTVGRQEYQKGHRFLIEAFVKVVADHPNAHLLITGREGHSSAQLEQLMDSLGLGASITILGHRSDVPEVLAASDIFAFPSLYEGLGGALIEALALELPVVASDIPALREVVREGENALLVPPADPVALATAITSLLDDPHMMAEYGTRSREIFDAEFRAEDATDAMISLLTAVAAGTAGEDHRVPLDDDGLNELLHAMHGRRGILALDSRWSIAARWSSYKAEFTRARSDAGDIAVKFDDGWSPRDARLVVREEDRVRALFSTLPAGPVGMPTALGWSEDPPGVALEFVEGTKLFDIARDPFHPVWNDGDEAVLDLVRSCGHAIGAYHSAGDPNGEPSSSMQREHLLAAARRAGVPARTVLQIEPRLEWARGYRVSPNDFIVTDDHRLVMIDPPHVRRYEHVHSDVSTFLFELHRSFYGDGPLSPHDGKATLLLTLRKAFLDGYAATGPIPMTSPIDEWTIRLYEVSKIMGFAYTRMRRKQPRSAVAPLRWAAQVRRGLGSPPQHQ